VIRLLPAGATAPDFALDGSDGSRHRLGELLRESLVLLLFYPGNDTPG
jgi:peroxiredoxin